MFAAIINRIGSEVSHYNPINSLNSVKTHGVDIGSTAHVSPKMARDIYMGFVAFGNTIDPTRGMTAGDHKTLGKLDDLINCEEVRVRREAAKKERADKAGDVLGKVISDIVSGAFKEEIGKVVKAKGNEGRMATMSDIVSKFKNGFGSPNKESEKPVSENSFTKMLADMTYTKTSSQEVKKDNSEAIIIVDEESSSVIAVNDVATSVATEAAVEAVAETAVEDAVVVVEKDESLLRYKKAEFTPENFKSLLENILKNGLTDDLPMFPNGSITGDTEYFQNPLPFNKEIYTPEQLAVMKKMVKLIKAEQIPGTIPNIVLGFMGENPFATPGFMLEEGATSFREVSNNVFQNTIKEANLTEEEIAHARQAQVNSIINLFQTCEELRIAGKRVVKRSK